MQFKLLLDYADIRRRREVRTKLNLVSIKVGHNAVQSSFVLEEFLQRLFQARLDLLSGVEEGVVAVLHVGQLLLNRRLDLRVTLAVAFNLTEAFGPQVIDSVLIPGISRCKVVQRHKQLYENF